MHVSGHIDSEQAPTAMHKPGRQTEAPMGSLEGRGHFWVSGGPPCSAAVVPKDLWDYFKYNKVLQTHGPSLLPPAPALSPPPALPCSRLRTSWFIVERHFP